MEFALFVYAASILPSIKVTCIVFAFSVMIVLGMCYLWNVLDEKIFKPKKVFFVTPVVLLSIGCLIPSEKTMYMMAAAYGSQQLVQSEAADKVVKIVNGKLDQYLEEIDKSVKEKVK